MPGGFSRITEDVFTWINTSIDTSKGNKEMKTIRKKMVIMIIISLVNGGWGEWTQWSSCQQDCRQHRFRACIKPPPTNGGTDCVGDTHQNQECSDRICPIIITSSQEVDLSHLNTDIIKVLAIGGGGGKMVKNLYKTLFS